MVWTKGGAPIDTAHVHVRTSDFDTVFFVRQAARSDSGEYELTVQIENMKDTATVRIRVVGARPAGGESGGDAGREREARQPRSPDALPSRGLRGLFVPESCSAGRWDWRLRVVGALLRPGGRPLPACALASSPADSTNQIDR